MNRQLITYKSLLPVQTNPTTSKRDKHDIIQLMRNLKVIERLKKKFSSFTMPSR
jgi:hypothetical protein